MNNRRLLAYHQEMEGFKDSILYQFLSPKIRFFYKQNGIRIQTLVSKVGELNKEFFEYEGDRLKKGEDKKPVLLEGKTAEEFDLRLNELMDREVNIIL